MHELSLVYADNVHGGDKRKTSQQCFSVAQITDNENCHEKSILRGLALTSGLRKEFARSRAFLGSITSIQRSRVGELQNPEEDKPLAPHWRVSR